MPASGRRDLIRRLKVNILTIIIYLFTYLLTYHLLHGVEPFWRSQLVLNQFRNSPHWMESES